MCQAVRLCESWLDAFACKRASTKSIIPFLSAICAPHTKKKNPAQGRKTLKGCYGVGGNVKVILFTLILYWRKVIEYAKGSLRQSHIIP